MKMKKNSSKNLKQAVCGLCLVGLVVGIVVTNDEVLKSTREGHLLSRNDNSPLQKLNRAIASAEPRNAFKDVNEEKELSEKIFASTQESSADRSPANYGRSPSAIDEIIHGEFSDNYRIVRDKIDGQSKVIELRFEENLESSTKPKSIANVTEFLEKYKDVWAISFKRIVPSSREEDPAGSLASFTFQLQDEKNASVGTAEITLKAGGLTHLQFRRQAAVQD